MEITLGHTYIAGMQLPNVTITLYLRAVTTLS